MNPYLILGVVLAVGVAGAGGLYQGHKLGKAEVQQAWDKEKAEQLAEYAKAQDEARAKEQALQANADKLRKEKDAEIRNINARATALSNSLQQRQTRSEAGSLSSSSGARSALKQCYAQYEALRK